MMSRLLESNIYCYALSALWQLLRVFLLQVSGFFSKTFAKQFLQFEHIIVFRDVFKFVFFSPAFQ